jgi:hypothetical protein
MMINPSLCASALNLFSEIKDAPRSISTTAGDSHDGDALSLSRVDNNNRTADCLNSNSRVSGLDLLVEASLPSFRAPSMMSLSSSINTNGSSHDASRLFHRVITYSFSESGRRRVEDMRNYARLDDTQHSNQGNSKKNAEWDEFK